MISAKSPDIASVRAFCMEPGDYGTGGILLWGANNK